MERYLKENLILQSINQLYFAYVIMTYMQGSGYKFYLIMPGIVIKYIKNTFSSHFVLRKPCNAKNFKKFVKRFTS